MQRIFNSRILSDYLLSLSVSQSWIHSAGIYVKKGRLTKDKQANEKTDAYKNVKAKKWTSFDCTKYWFQQGKHYMYFLGQAMFMNFYFNDENTITKQ